MAMAVETRLSDEKLRDLLAVLKASDSVELKLTIPEDVRAGTARALGVDALDGQIRQVFFFDTPQLDLNQAGVVVRARRRQGEMGDTVVKLRPVVPQDLPKAIRRAPGFVVECDAMPGDYVCSASFKGGMDNATIRKTVMDGGPIRKLFTKEQRSFYRDSVPSGPALDDLTVLGPIPTLRYKFRSSGFDRKMVGELWLYPDGSQIVELSTKALPSEAVQAFLEWRDFLQQRGIELTGEQQTKTKAALEFFTRPAA